MVVLALAPLFTSVEAPRILVARTNYLDDNPLDLPTLSDYNNPIPWLLLGRDPITNRCDSSMDYRSDFGI